VVVAADTWHQCSAAAAEAAAEFQLSATTKTTCLYITYEVQQIQMQFRQKNTSAEMLKIKQK